LFLRTCSANKQRMGFAGSMFTRQIGHLVMLLAHPLQHGCPRVHCETAEGAIRSMVQSKVLVFVTLQTTCALWQEHTLSPSAHTGVWDSNTSTLDCVLAHGALEEVFGRTLHPQPKGPKPTPRTSKPMHFFQSTSLLYSRLDFRPCVGDFPGWQHGVAK